MMEYIISTVVWAAIIQGLLLGILYVFSEKYRSLANRLLGFFLFALIVEAISVFVPVSELFGYPLHEYFSLPEAKLFFPLLFLHFVLEKVGRSKPFYHFFLIHYALAFAVIGGMIFNLLLFLVTGFTLEHYLKLETIELLFFSQQYYAFFLAIIAFIIAIRETLRYRTLVKNEYSDFDMLEINWLWQFIFIILPICLLWGGELVRIALGGTGLSDIVLVTWGLLVIFIYFVSYKAFRHQNLFEGRVNPSLELVEKGYDLETSKNYDELSVKINSYMASGKHFLNHDLNIYDLSKEIGVSTRQISNCINQNMGVNFSEWVNNYRVDHAMSLLTDTRNNHLSIEGIGKDSGFNSRSAMYTAFKKKTSKAPGYFRQID